MRILGQGQSDQSPLVVYFSSASGNTHRFVEMLGTRSIRISRFMKDKPPVVDEPFVLICPSYGDHTGAHSVPKQVIHFLNIAQNRDMIEGVIGAGNRNFGEFYGYAGDIIARKCKVPLLYKFELSGTSTDVVNVRKGLEKLWNSLTSRQTMKQTATSMKM